MPGPARKYTKTRGCRHYNSRGIMRLATGFCEAGEDCGYVHPNDPEWPLLEWSGNVGRLKGTTRSRSRSRDGGRRRTRDGGMSGSREGRRSRSREGRGNRSREGRRSRSRSWRPRSVSRERDSGWDRKRMEREKEKNRDPERVERQRSRDRYRDRLGRRRSSSPPSSTRSRHRRLSSPGRRSSYHRERDRSPRPPSTSPSRRRRDSFASSTRFALSPSTSTRRPRRQSSVINDIVLPQSPEEQKPDFRELERARLLDMTKRAKAEQALRETIDLREARTPTAMGPPPPDLSPPLRTASTPPPPPAEIPPPVPTESPSFPQYAMTIVGSPISTHPPPPLPQAPDFDDVLQDSQLLGDTWSTRVHLLTDLVRLSSEIEAVQDDFQTVQQLAEASTMLPEDVQVRLRERLRQTDAQLREKQVEYERLCGENASSASGMWPIPREQMERDATLLAAYQEMVGYLVTLTRATGDVQEALAVLGVGRMPAAPVLPEVLREEVEVMIQEAAVPPRRNGAADEDLMDGVPPPCQPPVAPTPILPPSERAIPQRDFDEISSRLDGIEKDLYAIDDAVWQRENELRDEFMAELEAKTLEWYTFMSQGGKRDGRGTNMEERGDGKVEEGGELEDEEEEEGDLEEDGETEIMKRELCKMRAQTTEGAKEVDQMTEILENFQTRLLSVEGQQSDANLEYQAALQRNGDLHSRLAALEDAGRASTEQLAALHTMVSLQPPSPPSSPAPLPSVDILHALREPLKAELRRAAMPIIEDARAKVTVEIDENVNVLYGTVFERAEPSVRVLKALERVLVQGGISVNGFVGASGKEGGSMNGAASH